MTIKVARLTLFITDSALRNDTGCAYDAHPKTTSRVRSCKLLGQPSTLSKSTGCQSNRSEFKLRSRISCNHRILKYTLVDCDTALQIALTTVVVSFKQVSMSVRFDLCLQNKIDEKSRSLMRESKQIKTF
jgi:hypothetical protein